MVNYFTELPQSSLTPQFLCSLIQAETCWCVNTDGIHCLCIAWASHHTGSCASTFLILSPPSLEQIGRNLFGKKLSGMLPTCHWTGWTGIWRKTGLDLGLPGNWSSCVQCPLIMSVHCVGNTLMHSTVTQADFYSQGQIVGNSIKVAPFRKLFLTVCLRSLLETEPDCVVTIASRAGS